MGGTSSSTGGLSSETPSGGASTGGSASEGGSQATGGTATTGGTTAGSSANPLTLYQVGGDPRFIISGPDDALWFTECTGNKIGRISTSGTLTEYPVPTTGSCPSGITIVKPVALVGQPVPVGFQVVFTERSASKIGVLNSVDGNITETALPRATSYPEAITADSAGVVWFTETGTSTYSMDRLGSMDLATQTITEYELSNGGAMSSGIYAEADGTLWFAEMSATQGRIGMRQGQRSVECTVPSWEAQPYRLTIGPDGNLWFTEYSGGIARLTKPTGTSPSCAGFSFTEFATPSSLSHPVEIITGPHCATKEDTAGLWFTETRGNLACADINGNITEYPLGSGISPLGLALGADGALWFTEPSRGRIGRWQHP